MASRISAVLVAAMAAAATLPPAESGRANLLQTRASFSQVSGARSSSVEGANGFSGWSGPGSDGTYAQNYQDVWAVALAQRNRWPTAPVQGQGFFLDLGAYHGTRCSNSALLEKKLGWGGICVEPRPEGFEDRSCILVSRALSDVADQTVRFNGEDQRRHIAEPSDGGGAGTDVKTLTIGELLDCVNGTAAPKPGQPAPDCSGVHGRARVPNLINFASLDIEGMESSILATFPWKKVKVGAWVVEQAGDAGRPAEKQEAARKTLQAQGYIKAPVENAGVDEYWVLPEYWDDSLAKKEWRMHPKGSGGC